MEKRGVFMVLSYDNGNPNFTELPIEVTQKKFNGLMERQEFDFVDFAYHKKNNVPYHGKYICEKKMLEHLKNTNTDAHNELLELIELERAKKQQLIDNELEAVEREAKRNALIDKLLAEHDAKGTEAKPKSTRGRKPNPKKASE